jgi:hypothetical protein
MTEPAQKSLLSGGVVFGNQVGGAFKEKKHDGDGDDTGNPETGNNLRFEVGLHPRQY